MSSDYHLVIDFGDFTNENFNINLQRTYFLLHIAKTFLEKIPPKLLPYEKNRTYFEAVAAGFLLFIISARDALLQQINADLGWMLPDNKVYLSTLKEKLKTNQQNPKCIKILKLLENCTEEPYRLSNTVGDIKRDKSWLWELDFLRNRIGHRGVLFWKNDSRTIDTKRTLVVTNDIEEENPYDYFKNCFENFELLTKNIHKILSENGKGSIL